MLRPLRLLWLDTCMKGGKIYVGLSGGVDSAVSAALLLKAGAQVIGVFIKGWYPSGMPCTWAEDRRDAMRVAARLGIPFMTLDASAEYKKGVIDYLLGEYAAGRTPNPDVMCNREVKFGAFYDYARAHGADAIATGHYARNENGALLRGLDESKDQSYFLWAVSKDAIAHTIFPVGAMRKDAVRGQARALRLPVAVKRDSQGICFLGSISVEEFLAHEFGAEPGIAVNEQGTEVGRHPGVIASTIGQRVALRDAAPGPWYVLRKDVRANKLVVSRSPHSRGGPPRSIPFDSANWLADAQPGAHLTAQYRYHGPLISGALSEDRAAFIPAAPLPETAAAGQSLVLYAGNQCVGGGIIGQDAGGI